MSDAAVPNTERVPFRAPYYSRSEQIGELVKALAQAQLKFDPIFKENINPMFKSKYADLSAVIAATQKHLAENGLVVMQLPTVEAETLNLTTILAHTSGQFIQNMFSTPATMREAFNNQTIGSALTYARRYALQAILGVAAEVDDDATAAVGGGTKEAAQNVAQQKIAQHKAKAGSEGIRLVPWKENTVVVAGNGLQIIRSSMTEEQKLKFHFKNDFDAKGWTLPASEAHLFASICDNLKVPFEWVEAVSGDA